MVARRKKFWVWWYRSGAGLKAALLLIGCLFGSMLLSWGSQEDIAAFESNLLVFVLVNLNIAVLFVLAFMVGRNVVKLIFDRRRRLLGSKLRLRLVVAFVGLTLIPTIILFVMASDLLSKAMEGWFSSQVESAISGSVEVARHHYSLLKDLTLGVDRKLADEITKSSILGAARPEVDRYLEARRKEDALFSIKLLRQDGAVIGEAHSPAAVIESFSEPQVEASALKRAGREGAFVLFEEKEPSQFVRGYAPIVRSGRDAVLVTTMRVSPELASALASVNDSFKEYEQLKLFRHPLRSGYILTLSMITGLILFAAIWIGFYIAREISVPIQRLAEGTRAVAIGNYDFKLSDTGDDEIGVLVKSFNKMTADLKASQVESERGKLYIETILANLAVGVIGIDTASKVTFVNAAANGIFGFEASGPVLARPISEVMGRAELEQIQPLIDAIEDKGEPQIPGQTTVAEREIAVMAQGRELKIVCTAGKIKEASGNRLGTLLIFDDITELAKAQHMSAWREVARRIAHEIKNPLTPIQLSAQRLSKYFADRPDPTVSECTQTIVENVDSIKRLANEFSNFARMPTAEFKLANLNVLISDTLAPFPENHPEIVFQFIGDNRMPEIHMDREQIRRMIINLIDNAIAAVGSSPEPKIVIKSNYDRRRRMANLEFCDNGPGISNQDKVRIFDPYFTTKAGGTGLGLAIVSSIISDHQGVIRVYDNRPRGAKFIVDLPATMHNLTQRRLASA